MSSYLKSEAADMDVNVPAQHPKPTDSLHLHLWWETPLPAAAVKYNRETWRLLKRQTRSSAFLVNDNFNYRMCIHEYNIFFL